MIKAAILLLVAHAVIPRLRRRSAAERHALWAAVLAVATVLPVLDLVRPVLGAGLGAARSRDLAHDLRVGIDGGHGRRHRDPRHRNRIG